MVNQEEIMRQITAAVDLHNKGALSQARRFIEMFLP